MADEKRFKFIPEDWLTPNTYDSNYSCLPQGPGVYLLVLREFSKNMKSVRQTICYVGSSGNLSQRCKNHPTKTKIMKGVKSKFADVACYFEPCADYLEREKFLIKQTQARCNKQWR